jgi:hypothetical protein
LPLMGLDARLDRRADRNSVSAHCFNCGCYERRAAQARNSGSRSPHRHSLGAKTR